MDKRSLEETAALNLQFEKRGGLLPVVVQERKTKDILMLGYANRAAVMASIENGYATFFSTSRQALWQKGETSGDSLRLHEIRVDCDQDALIYVVEMEGNGACHTKNKQGNARKSCFYRALDPQRKVLHFTEA